MTEKQKKAIKEALSIYKKESLNINPDIEGAYEIGFGEGLVEVINNPEKYGLQPLNEWVSVTDRLPDDSYGRILTYVREVNDLGISYFIWICSYSPLHGFTDKGQAYHVTHWRQLPSAPINEREEG